MAWNITFFQLDTMIYRTEFTNAAVFKKLQEKIPQVIGHAYHPLARVQLSIFIFLSIYFLSIFHTLNILRIKLIKR